MNRALAVAAALALVPVLAPPAAAASDRMVLHCGDDREIERTNGSSWWGVDHDAGYVSAHLLITDGADVPYEKDYGTKARGDRSTCVADHFGSTWTVELVRTR